MKTWLIVPWTCAEDMVEIARHADGLGFEGLMGADHGFIPQSMANDYPYTDGGRPPVDGEMPYPDVWTTIAAMASVTVKLKFSTAVYVLPLRNPVEVAKATGTLARLSNNRVILGAGVGWMKEEFDVYGIDFKTRGKRMDEMIEVMRKLWRGGYVEHHGDCFDFPPLQISPSPDRAIPIYIGGDSRVALKRAARIGQGWIGAHNHIDDVPAQLKLLRDLRAEYGRADQPFETVIPIQQFDQIDKIQRLHEQGMTSSVFGFSNYQLPLADKLKSMDVYAKKSGLSI